MHPEYHLPKANVDLKMIDSSPNYKMGKQCYRQIGGNFRPEKKVLL